VEVEFELRRILFTELYCVRVVVMETSVAALEGPRLLLTVRRANGLLKGLLRAVVIRCPMTEAERQRVEWSVYIISTFCRYYDMHVSELEVIRAVIYMR
jgi:hypothetical protein